MTSAARLSIIAALAPGEALSFTELKRAAHLSDGNLSVQTGKLIGAGYISASKETRGRRPVTHFRITQAGLDALKLHIRRLQALVATKAGLLRPTSPGNQPPDDAQVWNRKGTQLSTGK